MDREVCGVKVSDAVWASILGTGVWFEVEMIRRGRGAGKDIGTFTMLTKRFFHTDHPVGRGVFVGAWSALTWWFVRHILDEEDAAA